MRLWGRVKRQLVHGFKSDYVNFTLNKLKTSIDYYFNIFISSSDTINLRKLY